MGSNSALITTACSSSTCIFITTDIDVATAHLGGKVSQAIIFIFEKEHCALFGEHYFFGAGLPA